MTEKTHPRKKTQPGTAAYVIRLSDGEHPAGHLFFRLERLNRIPVTDAEAATLVQNPVLTPGPAGMTFDELTRYIAGVIRTSAPDAKRADVWLRPDDAVPVGRTVRHATVYDGRKALSDSHIQAWQALADSLKS